MKLSKDEVQNIAKLARLELNEKEINQFAHQLSDVLDYFEKLKDINTDNVEETSQVTGLENVYRDDKVDQSKIQKQLIEQAADNEDNMIKTKPVF